ncbi:MAG: hypothetical protein Q4F54_05085 [Coriobacteriia bacterium]|nr:hypothetical protein [Coriobacteriia bacterium]
MSYTGEVYNSFYSLGSVPGTYVRVDASSLLNIKGDGKGEVKMKKNIYLPMDPAFSVQYGTDARGYLQIKIGTTEGSTIYSYDAFMVTYQKGGNNWSGFSYKGEPLTANLS